MALMEWLVQKRSYETLGRHCEWINLCSIIKYRRCCPFSSLNARRWLVNCSCFHHTTVLLIVLTFWFISLHYLCRQLLWFLVLSSPLILTVCLVFSFVFCIESVFFFLIFWVVWWDLQFTFHQLVFYHFIKLFTEVFFFPESLVSFL